MPRLVWKALIPVGVTLAVLVAAPVGADCTSSVRYVRDADGAIEPIRDVQCAATEEEKAQEIEQLAGRIAACEAAGFGVLCGQMAADYEAGTKRHIATILLRRGDDAETISTRTDLSVEEIESLQTELGVE